APGTLAGGVDARLHRGQVVAEILDRGGPGVLAMEIVTGLGSGACGRVWRVLHVHLQLQRRRREKARSPGALDVAASGGQARRAIISFLISAMARAGFRPLGQVRVQFMMVWQRYSLNGSSRSSRRAPVSSSRESMIQR